MRNNIQQTVATLGFIGYLPYAPGTFGTVCACVLVILIKPGDGVLCAAILISFLLGTASSHSAEKILGKDSGHIVIDEFCGYLIAVLFVPPVISYLLAAFVLFRFFDILKPPPIRNVEKAVPGGAGIMLDDVLAGIYANLCIQIWIRFFPGN